MSVLCPKCGGPPLERAYCARCFKQERDIALACLAALVKRQEPAQNRKENRCASGGDPVVAQALLVLELHGWCKLNEPPVPDELKAPEKQRGVWLR